MSILEKQVDALMRLCVTRFLRSMRLPMRPTTPIGIWRRHVTDCALPSNMLRLFARSNGLSMRDSRMVISRGAMC